MSENELRRYISSNGSYIQCIDNPDEELQYCAVKEDVSNILYIKHPTIRIQQYVLDKNINLLRYIKNKEVIDQFKHEIIKHILTLVDPENIYFLASEEAIDLIKILTKQNINWPELAIIKKSLQADNKLTESNNFDHNIEKEQIAVVQKDPYAIRYIKNPSEKVQLAAIQRNGFAIKYIEDPSELVQLVAVQRYGVTIEHIKDPNEKVQLAAVQNSGVAIKYIKNPSELVQLTAVHQFAFAIRLIKEPTKDVVITAILKIIQLNNYYDYLKKLIEKYEHNNWPELDVIKKSLEADGKL